MPSVSLYSYEALVTALETRFGTAHQAELHRMRLKGRTRRRKEGLPELAEDIDHLARLAYPDAAMPMVELLAKDQFVDALPDKEMRLKTRQSRPGSLREALEVALELESYQIASRQRHKAVRGTWLEAEHEEQQVGVPQPSAMPSEKPPWVDELIQCLQQCLRQQNHPEAKARSGSYRQTSNPQKKQVTCWKCKQPGQIRRNCTMAESEMSNGASHGSSPVSNNDGSQSQFRPGNYQ